VIDRGQHRAVSLPARVRIPGREDRSELPGERRGRALQAFPGDPQRLELELDRERVTFAVSFEAVGLRVRGWAGRGCDAPRGAGWFSPPYVTGCRRGFGEYRRPTFAHGRPSNNTTSAVKSLLPRISDEPTP
jgi:hypothetical protein